MDTVDEGVLDDTADCRSQDGDHRADEVPQCYDIDKSSEEGPAPNARRALEVQLAAAAPQRQKELLFRAIWPRILQLMPAGSDEERMAFIDEFMKEHNGYILDCIFDPALTILGLSLINMQLIARAKYAEAIAAKANENTAAALAQKELANRENR